MRYAIAVVLLLGCGGGKPSPADSGGEPNDLAGAPLSDLRSAPPADLAGAPADLASAPPADMASGYACVGHYAACNTDPSGPMYCCSGYFCLPWQGHQNEYVCQ